MNKRSIHQHRLVGLCGYARSGKDTAALALTEQGWFRLAFADQMRDSLYRLNPPVLARRTWSARGVRELVDQFGWDGIKASKNWGPPVRELMQGYGQELRRIDPLVWVRPIVREIEDRAGGSSDRFVVVTDVRYANEAFALQNLGGQIVRITRPGVGPANDHDSEVIDFYVDLTIVNDGTVRDLRESVQEALLWR